MKIATNNRIQHMRKTQLFPILLGVLVILATATAFWGCGQSSSTLDPASTAAPNGFRNSNPVADPGIRVSDKAGTTRSMGTLHNLILAEYDRIQTPEQKANPTWEGMRENIIKAYETVYGDIAPSLQEKRDIADAIHDEFLQFYNPQSGVVSPNFSIIEDPYQRNWAEGLFQAVSECHSGTEIKLAVADFGINNGLPVTNPLYSYLDVTLHSADYWDAYSVTYGGWGDFWRETAADAWGSLEGFVVGSLATPVVGFGYGLFKGVSYSVMMHAWNENN